MAGDVTIIITRLWQSRNWRNRWRIRESNGLRKQTFIRILLAFAFAGVVAIGIVAWRIYSYDSHLEIVHADAAIVLGAAVWDDQPSPVFRERINHAVDLYHDGRVRKLIFTGGQGDGDELAEAIVAQRYAVEHGVPEADILTETRSRTTEQNLYYATNQATVGHHLTRFFIVSDPLHMKRAMRMAHDMGMDAYPSSTPTTRYQSWGSQFWFLVRETYFYLTYSLRRTFNLGTH
ncbi:MAG: YdcF family protein [Chloroflexi bacterium]|nr:YdcF family protein [Chloroflexota bacterium]